MIKEDFVINKYDYEFRGTRRFADEMGVATYDGQFYYDGLPFGGYVRMIIDLMVVDWYSRLQHEILTKLIDELHGLAFEGDAF